MAEIATFTYAVALYAIFALVLFVLAWVILARPPREDFWEEVEREWRDRNK